MTSTRLSPVTVALAALVALAGLVGLAQPAHAQITVKLGSIVPKESLWHVELQQLASELKKTTAGRVNMIVYAGTNEDEGGLIRKMPFQLHAASLTVNGLSLIDESFNLFTIPLFFQSHEELGYVIDKMVPTFKARLAAKKYVFLGWGNAGWVQIFSRQPISKVDEFKQAKLFTTAGFDWMVEWYKKNGYRPVPLSPTDMMTSLQTGQVDVVPVTPLAALYLQWYTVANHMLDVKLAPLVGATLIHESIWNRLSEEDRAALAKAVDATDRRLRAQVPKKDAEAVTAMEKRGLKVVRVAGTPEAAKFEGEAKRFSDSMRGWHLPAEILDEATKYREAYRRERASAGGGDKR